MSCKIEILLTADKYVLRVEILQISLTSRNITGKKSPPVTRSSHPGVFWQKDVLKNSTKFTGKYLCQSLFFDELINLQASAF